MKVWLVAVLASLAGIAIGVGITVAEFAPAEEVFVSVETQVAPETNFPGGAPRAVVEGSVEHNFGVMERNVKGRHSFVIRNEGTSPLTIKVGHTTCKCTVADLKDSSLRPGESTTVDMEWEAPGYVDNFNQSAEIQTNDPLNPVIRLSIQGNVIQSVRPVPEEMKLPSVSANEGATSHVHLYGFKEEPLEILSCDLVNADYADSFEIETRPLTEDELAEMSQAKSGHLITLRVKSGLPIGPLNQTIRVETNVPTAEVVEIPVHLTVASDISVITGTPGLKFVEDKNLIRLGKLKSAKGAKARLYVLVKGPYADETELSVATIEPSESLQVKLGEALRSGKGGTVRFPLDVIVPPGTRPISRVGGEQGELGRIMLHTTHPIAKEVRLFVQFAVE